MLSQSSTRKLVTTSHGARALSSKPKANPLFSFVPSNPLPEKPRKVGRTEIRGPYYSNFGPRMAKDVFDTFGEYIDGVKYSGGTFTLQSLSSLKENIKIAHDHGAYVSTGGFLEKILASSNGCLLYTSDAADE